MKHILNQTILEVSLNGLPQCFGYFSVSFSALSALVKMRDVGHPRGEVAGDEPLSGTNSSVFSQEWSYRS